MAVDQAKTIEDETPKRGRKLAVVEPTPLPTEPSRSTLLSVLDRVLSDPAMPIERISQAFDLYQRVDRAQGQKAYVEAKAAFKANAPTIFKDMENKQYKSKYSSIGNVVNAVNTALSQHGLDASWEFDQGDNSIKVTCILTHSGGHSERVSLSAPPDVSGSKNPIQQIKSTTTYLKLATFEAVTGVASREGNADDDGNAAGAVTETINEKQLAELRGLIVDTNTDIGRFCTYIAKLSKQRVDRVEDIPAAKFQAAKEALESKQRAQI